jgi:hypothetical protein
MPNELRRRAPAKSWIESGELARILPDCTAEAISTVGR